MTDPVTLMAFNEKNNELKFSSPVELTAAKDEGKKPTFSIVAYTGVPMQAGGFYQPVIVELTGVKSVNASIPIFRDHDPGRIVGQGEYTVDSQIRVDGSMMGSGSDVQEIVELNKDGFKWQASIGASVTRKEFLEAGKKAMVNGREVTGPLVIARESLLQEVSFVAIGADQSTSAAIAASNSLRKATDMKFEQWLEGKGVDPSKIEAGSAVHTLLKSQFDQEQESLKASRETGTKATFSDLDVEVAKTRKEQARRQEITKVAARFLSEHPGSCDVIEASARLAIEANQEPATFELTMLRDFRNEHPVLAGRKRPSSNLTNGVIEAAICQAAKLGTVETDYTEQELEAAHKHFRGGIGLKQLLLHCARENGCHELDATSSEVMRAAFAPDLRAAASTISLPNILSNVANKFITEAFMSVEDSWRTISAIRPVADFKQITNHSLTGDLQYTKVGPDGEIKDGTLGEQVYYNQADTYGKRLAITRRDIINDDLGAFAAVSRRLGRGGALAINDVFWTAFMDNSSFFTSGRGNYDDGTDTALDAAGLKAAMTLWDALTDPDGKPLGSSAKFILVPPGQWEPAMALMNSTTVNTGGSSSVARVANNNPWAGMFTVVKSRYLANSSYTGYSALAWYLLADPNDIPVIETCFLQGKEMPTVETGDMEFSKLGVQFRAYHDFGVTKQEYRGGCKFKGEA